ncbi:MAG: hypothetical protein L6Q57_02835 [Alphaproteobacteria bacterium]|nr:hypothetical protein [Alphaproteobacteria bacterium]
MDMNLRRILSAAAIGGGLTAGTPHTAEAGPLTFKFKGTVESYYNDFMNTFMDGLTFSPGMPISLDIDFSNADTSSVSSYYFKAGQVYLHAAPLSSELNLLNDTTDPSGNMVDSLNLTLTAKNNLSTIKGVGTISIHAFAPANTISSDGFSPKNVTALMSGAFSNSANSSFDFSYTSNFGTSWEKGRLDSMTVVPSPGALAVLTAGGVLAHRRRRTPPESAPALEAA